MIFAEFYHDSTGWNGKDFSGPVKLIPACGSDSVLPIDARLNVIRAAGMAREVCKRRGYKGFTLNAGESYTRNRAILPLEIV